ncbi:FAD/NAD(P)-binding protein [Sphingobium sp. H39-3-25]|uniref:FAD/NAD(P)-binding protein n=1 Tax=Sphingobium TaxID=165695 RepID=UPI0023B8F821|nr:FAD/NAD(P)-binding protein [Sphingobium arseniciresistens]
MGDNEHDKRAWAVYCACRISDTLYAMNPFLTQQNFYSQQLRALALVSVIAGKRLLPGRRNVCIVGAGVAGRTLAAGFTSVGASVRLIEARTTPFEQYRDATHRELHPNIIFWPKQQPTPATALPFLNWAQSQADMVVEDILDEWQRGFGPKVDLVHDKVIRLHQTASGVLLELQSGANVEADIAVLATGFKTERSLGPLKSPSYWSPNAIADDGQAVLVSGTGDGGLIDVLSPILGTKVTRAAHMLAVALTDSEVRHDILEVEAERALHRIAGTGDSTDPCEFYRKVVFSHETQGKLSSFAGAQDRPSNRKITLLYRSTSPYSFTAAPINKLLLAYFSNGTRRYVTAVKGELEVEEDQCKMIPDNDICAPVDPPSEFDRVIVRHGAEPAAADLLTATELAGLRDKAIEHSAAADVSDYDRDVFRWTNDGMGKSGVSLETLPRMVRKTLLHIGRAYGLDFQTTIIVDDCFTNGRPIKVVLDAEDRRKAEQLRLFPLRVGPASVQVAPVNIHRNRPPNDEA